MFDTESLTHNIRYERFNKSQNGAMATLNENVETDKSDRNSESRVDQSSSSTSEHVEPPVNNNKKKLPELPPRKVKSEAKSLEIVTNDDEPKATVPEKSNEDNRSNVLSPSKNENGNDDSFNQNKDDITAVSNGVLSNEAKVHEPLQVQESVPNKSVDVHRQETTISPKQVKDESSSTSEGDGKSTMQEYFVGLRAEDEDESSITLDKAKTAQELLLSRQDGPTTTNATVDLTHKDDNDQQSINNGTKTTSAHNNRPNLRVDTFQVVENDSKSKVEITDETRLSQLDESVPIETVAAQGGWTAKRVSITGQLFFERDADGTIQLDRPKDAVPQDQQKVFGDEEDDEDSDIEQEIVARKKSMEQFSSSRNRDEEPIKTSSSTLNSPTSSTSSLPLATQEKPAPLDEETIQKIQSLEGNKRCVDCGASGQSGPTWASLSFGVLLCMSCSGTHRAFGSHISLVKSLTLDNWTSEQIAYLYPNGGNAKFKNAVKSDGKPSARYTTEEAALYRARLRALVKNEPLPDKVTQSVATQASISPPPSPQGSYRNLRMLQESKDATSCLICGRAFSVIVRKHFCRNCDRAVCARCAPAANTKPLPQLGLGMTPVRHCSRCYRSPFIDWNALGLSSAEQAAEAEVRTEGSNGGHLSSRRKTIGGKKVVRRKTLGEALVGMMKRG